MKFFTIILLAIVGWFLFNSFKFQMYGESSEFSTAFSTLDWSNFSAKSLDKNDLKFIIEELNTLENCAAFSLETDLTSSLLGRAIRDVKEARKKVKTFYDTNTTLIGKNGKPLQYWILDKAVILDALKKNRLSKYGGLAAYPATDKASDQVFHTLVLQPAEHVMVNDSGEVIYHELVVPEKNNLYNFIDPCPSSCDETANNLTK